MSSKPGFLKRCQILGKSAGYFGRTVGSPPGLPGGGITGVLPVSGVGARISGSTPAAGTTRRRTCQFVAQRLGASAGGRCPRYIFAARRIGRLARSHCRCGGRALGAAVTWVKAEPARRAAAADHRKYKVSACFIRMRRKRSARAEVPRKHAELQVLR